MSRRGVDNEACAICGDIPYDSERRVLVDAGVRRSYCSQACLRTGVRKLQIARRKQRLRRGAIVLSFLLLAAGAGWVRHLLLRARPQRAIAPKTAPVVEEAQEEAIPFGPRWPPSDDDWQAEFARATWVDPLPGPARRRPVACRELFAAPSAHARCRTAGHCGVDLGGDLYGEHVYAAHDGVIDRVQRSVEDAPGGLSIRIAHWGGAVFTYYHHLAAVPTRLAVGLHVEAGDVIGLVGDSGLADARARLHFALAVRPSSALPEIYWDPEPLMAEWPLHTPERGSVAGLVAAEAPPERVAGTPAVRRVPSLRPAR